MGWITWFGHTFVFELLTFRTLFRSWFPLRLISFYFCWHLSVCSRFLLLISGSVHDYPRTFWAVACSGTHEWLRWLSQPDALVGGLTAFNNCWKRRATSWPICFSLFTFSYISFSAAFTLRSLPTSRGVTFFPGREDIPHFALYFQEQRAAYKGSYDRVPMLRSVALVLTYRFVLFHLLRSILLPPATLIRSDSLVATVPIVRFCWPKQTLVLRLILYSDVPLVVSLVELWLVSFWCSFVPVPPLPFPGVYSAFLLFLCLRSLSPATWLVSGVPGSMLTPVQCNFHCNISRLDSYGACPCCTQAAAHFFHLHRVWALQLCRRLTLSACDHLLNWDSAVKHRLSFDWQEMSNCWR